MNKKKQILLRRRVNILSATFFALILVISACKKEETIIGSGLQGDGLNTVTSDTFTLVTYTDSIKNMRSDENAVNLLGAYHDPVFGAVNCGIVTQITPEGLTQDFKPDSTLFVDSVILSLAYTSINFYANIDDLTVEVYEVDEVLSRDDQEYTVSSEPLVTGPNLVLPGNEVVSPDIISKPVIGGDTLSPQLRIKLDPSVGADLIADGRAGLLDANFKTNTFKGLYIKVTVAEGASRFGIPEGEGTVLYFVLENILSKMSVYYRMGAGEPEVFDFDINSSCARYTKIDYERSGTHVEQALSDTFVGREVFYTQGGALLGAVEFPHIANFYKNDAGELDPKIINKAELVLPIQDFTSDVFDPATRLFIGRLVGDNLYTFTSDYGLGGTLEGNTETYDEGKKEFRFRMTREIQGLLKGDIENTGYRIYAPDFFTSSVERIIFNGSNTSLKDKPRLEITYTEY